MAEKLAIYPGSFDPPTLGHLDIIRRAAELFDHLVVLVAAHGKAGLWPAERRRDLLLASLDPGAGIEVATFDGLLVDEFRRRGATTVVRGLRGAADLEHEEALFGVNTKLLPGFETVWLPTRPDLAAVSSSLVRDVARHGGRLEGLVPGPVAAALRESAAG